MSVTIRGCVIVRGSNYHFSIRYLRLASPFCFLMSKNGSGLPSARQSNCTFSPTETSSVPAGIIRMFFGATRKKVPEGVMTIYWYINHSICPAQSRKASTEGIMNKMGDFATCYDLYQTALDTEKLFCSSSSVQLHPLVVTTARYSHFWNYRELVTLLTLSGSLAETGLEPLTLELMSKNLNGGRS